MRPQRDYVSPDFLAMANVLMLTPQVPYPPRQGTALRNWGLLKGLADHHTVSLLSFASPDQSEHPAPPLASRVERFAAVPQPTRSLQERLWSLVTSRTPDLALRLSSAQFRQQLDAWLTTYAFDWVMVEGLEMAPFLDLMDQRETAPGRTRSASVSREARTRVVFDDHNCEYLLQQRAAQADRRRPNRWVGALYSTIQWPRLRRYEAEVCRRADVVVAVSETDAKELSTLAPEKEPLVLPNGLDVDIYAGFQDTAPLTEPSFVFTGTMDFRPNVDGVLWFADRVWPTVQEALPTAHLYIVGRHPHARLDRLRDQEGVVITGGVPDTRPYIRAATVYVVPLLVGGGTRLKILESTAMGRPVVATTLGAEGFVTPEHAMILADTPTAFADACIALAHNAEARHRWGEKAQAFARAYDWDALLPPLLDRLEIRT